MNILSYTGFVYLIECGGIYKVGCTTNLEKRIRNHQTGLPSPVTFIDSFQSYNHTKDESRIHRLLEKYKVQGKTEWFNIPKSWLDKKKTWFYSEYATPKTQEEIDDAEFTQRIRFCRIVIELPKLAQKMGGLNDQDFKSLYALCVRDYECYKALVEDGAIEVIS